MSSFVYWFIWEVRKAIGQRIVPRHSGPKAFVKTAMVLQARVDMLKNRYDLWRGTSQAGAKHVPNLRRLNNSLGWIDR